MNLSMRTEATWTLAVTAFGAVRQTLEAESAIVTLEKVLFPLSLAGFRPS